jgi:prepilin-type N-terminal cleavage/methylation domain-containing protein
MNIDLSKNGGGRSFRKGFTLVELLVVIVIIAALASVAFVMVTRVRKTADQALTLSNMRQLGTTLLSYASDKGRFPDRMGTVADSPRWDRAILQAMTSTATGEYKGEINRETAPELESVVKVFASPLDESAKLVDKKIYKKSFGIAGWTCNANGVPFNGLENNKGVPYGVLKRPDNCAMLSQNHLEANTVGGTSDLGMQGKPVDKFKKDGQLICFADGHVEKMPHNMTEDEFREQHEPGDRKNKVGN